MRMRGVTICLLVATALTGATSAASTDPGYSFATGSDASGKSCFARRVFGDPKLSAAGDRSYEIACGQDPEPIADLYLLQSDGAQAFQDARIKSCADPSSISDGKTSGASSVVLCKGRGGPDEPGAQPSKVIVSRAGNGKLALAEGAPQTADLLIHAAAIALGQEAPAKTGLRSAVLEKLQTTLGADITVQQFDYQSLVDAGSQSNGLWLFSQAGRYYSAAIAAHRVQWPNDIAGDADLKLEYALNLSNERRASEAARLFSEVARLAGSDLFIGTKLEVYLASDALNHNDRTKAKFHIDQFRDKASQLGHALDRPGLRTRLDLLRALSFRIMATVDAGDSAKVRADLANAAAELGRLPAETALWLRGAITSDLAGLEMREGRPAAAVTLLRSELDRLSHWATGTRIEGNLRVVLAQALSQSGDETGAEASFQAGFRIFSDQPENPGVSVEYAVPYIRFLIGRLEKAKPAQRDQINAAIFAAYEAIVNEGTAKTASEAAARIAAGPNGKLVRAWQDSVRSYRRAQARYNALSINASANDSTVQGLADQVEALRTASDALGRKIYNDVPRYDVVAYRPVALNSLQSILAPGEVFARIAIGANGGVGLLVSHDKLRPFVIKADASQIANLVKRVKIAASTKKKSAEWKAADIADTHLLFAAIFGEVAPELLADSNRRLILDTTGDLASLPFALLSTHAVPARTELADVPWLIKSLAIEVTPGTHAFVSSHTEPAAALKSFVGLANVTPLSAKRDERKAQMASVLTARHLAPTCELPLALLVNQVVLKRSGIDVEEAAAALHIQPKLIVGADFRPEQIKANKEVASADVLMFSTHGLTPSATVDTDVCLPPVALLASAPDLPVNGAQDMLIDVPAVLDMNLSAKLVVLAACSTGTPVPPNPGESGLPSGGDALSGLTRAFLYAGARSVLLTHWTIADENSVITNFFQSINANTDSVEALRKAQLSALGKTHTAAPYFWASYSLVGSIKP